MTQLTFTDKLRNLDSIRNSCDVFKKKIFCEICLTWLFYLPRNHLLPQQEGQDDARLRHLQLYSLHCHDSQPCSCCCLLVFQHCEKDVPLRGDLNDIHIDGL